MSLTLEIVTPEEKAYNDTIISVVLPTRDGEIDVLEGHIPLISIIDPGEIRVNKSGGMEYLAVDRGFVQIIGNKISVLTEGAIDVKEIDLSKVEAARKSAEDALEEAKNNPSDINPAELEKLEAQVRFSIAKELTKKRH